MVLEDLHTLVALQKMSMPTFQLFLSTGQEAQEDKR